MLGFCICAQGLKLINNLFLRDVYYVTLLRTIISLHLLLSVCVIAGTKNKRTFKHCYHG